MPAEELADISTQSSDLMQLFLFLGARQLRGKYTHVIPELRSCMGQ
jgi:hypothetical protein